MAVSTYLQMITLNANRLNACIKIWEFQFLSEIYMNQTKEISKSRCY